MREIKFRGKRIDNGEWVYGDLLTKYIHHKGMTIVENGCIYHEVDPETVGQYIGEKDIVGREIYEGDIALPGSTTAFGHKICPAYVTFRVATFGLYFVDEDDFDNCISWDGGPMFGNIHDNPELLEGD